MTNTAMTIAESKGMQPAELLNVLKNSLYPGATDESAEMVLSYCQAAGLDPLQKPVHIVPMYVKDASGSGGMQDVVMPGIGLYRIQAARSGEHAGTTEPEFGPEVTTNLESGPVTHPEWCRVTVYRIVQGQIASFTAKELWLENYATAGRNTDKPNAMWSKRKYGQLAKCAEAQALRKAFPEFGSTPTAEEMEGKEQEREVDAKPSKPESQALPQYPQDAFDANLPKWRDAIQSGKKTPDDIIAKVRTKGTLTEDQEQAIRELVNVEETDHADA